MRRLLMLLVLLAAIPAGARAEDFSGFHVGINAGSGWGRERDRSAPGPAAPPVAGDRVGSDLPPSAAGAAAGLRRPGPPARGADAR